MNKRFFSEKIVQWYELNHRDLPWRNTQEPYKIWLSEIILQQTRVIQGLPYYQKFLDKYPNINLLAAANEREVLRIWQGLGYYSRARNLHRCAKAIVKNFNGRFPPEFSELKKLPGIGEYTAAAMASFAFNQPVAVVDGNVYRVLSRVFGIDHDITSPAGKKFFSILANELIPQKHPGLFNQAIMEFGALQCLPQNPKCEACVFIKTCVANQQGLQKILPVKLRKAKVRKRYLFYMVFRHKDKIMMKKREGKDIWRGLYDFHLIETKRRQKIKDLLESYDWYDPHSTFSETKSITHLLTHQQLMVKFIEFEIPSSKEFNKQAKALGLKAFSRTRINHLPKPILIERYLRQDQ